MLPSSGAGCSLRGDFLEVGVLVLILGHAVVELALGDSLRAACILKILAAVGAIPVLDVRIAGVILRCRMVFGICMGAVFGLHARARGWEWSFLTEPECPSDQGSGRATA